MLLATFFVSPFEISLSYLVVPLLSSSPHKQFFLLQAALVGAMTIIDLPSSLQQRVHTYNQFLELQFDKSSLEVLFSM